MQQVFKWRIKHGGGTTTSRWNRYVRLGKMDDVDELNERLPADDKSDPSLSYIEADRNLLYTSLQTGRIERIQTF